MTTSTTYGGAEPAPLLVAGAWERAGTPLTVRAPGDGRVVGHTFEASADQLDRATAAAVGAFAGTRRSASFERGELLRRAGDLIGARLLTGGGGDGAYLAPMVLEQVPDTARLAAEEAFGPVVLVTPYDDLDEAFTAADTTPFGLQAGYFTRDLHRAWRAFEALEFGAVVVNDVPAFRVDSMPFGGVKGSGLGREGVRWTIADMTEPRLLVLAPDAG